MYTILETGVCFLFVRWSVQVGDEGVLLRWCVYSYALRVDCERAGDSLVVVGGNTLKETLSRSRRVPLPLERLWVACESDHPEFRTALGSDPSVLQDLQASGRVQFVSKLEIVFKATRVSEPTYAHAAECVFSTRRAFDAFAQAARTYVLFFFSPYSNSRIAY